MLEKIVTIEEVTVQPVSGFVTVREDTNVVENGKSIAKTVKHMATNSQIAFNPQGKTVVVAAAGTAPTGVQAPVYEKFNLKPQANTAL
jgi:hypothetical protein